MSDNTNIQVQIVENETIKVQLTEDEIIKVQITGISCAEGIIDEQAILNWIKQEVPSKVSVKRFETSYPYVSGLLKVYYNGIKESDITEISSTEFELPIDTLSDDVVEVEYFRKVE